MGLLVNFLHSQMLHVIFLFRNHNSFHIFDSMFHDKCDCFAKFVQIYKPCQPSQFLCFANFASAVYFSCKLYAQSFFLLCKHCIDCLLQNIYSNITKECLNIYCIKFNTKIYNRLLRYCCTAKHSMLILLTADLRQYLYNLYISKIIFVKL